MKPAGAKVDFEQERNNELIKTYNRLLEECDFISMPAIYNQVVEMPTTRFWVSEERAAIVIASMMKGKSIDNMQPNKREMFQEIYRRALLVIERDKTLSLLDVAMQVVLQPAPKFYMTPGTAKVYITKAKKKWYEERKRKLRHLF